MVNRCASLLVALCLLGADAAASVDAKTPLTGECLKQVADTYSVHYDVLLAILLVEGGTVGQNSRANQNGTYDIGPFQINSMHRETLAQMGISEQALRNNGCVNAAVAAWHLRRTLTDKVMQGVVDEDSYLRAIARYHSATPEYNERYAGKLRAAFSYIYSQEDR
ncbi:hypothetical protein SSTU70S_05484 [Stutzerimonas stutzeri]